MYATLEQQITDLNHQIDALRDDVERLQALVAKAISLSEATPVKRGPGRPRKTEPDMTTFSDG